MATPTSGQYVFSTASGPVDLFLTSGSVALGDPGAGGNAFDLEIFTDFNKGTSDPGFEGSAFVPAGMLNAEGRIANTSTTPLITLNNGDFWVTDFGGTDTIQAGSGNQTVTGGVATTIIGGTGTLKVTTGNLDVVSIGGAASATVNTLGNNGERVVIGANSATVFAGNNDTINAPSGNAVIVFGDSVTTDANMTVTGGPTAGFAGLLDLTSTAFGKVRVDGTDFNVVSFGADTISSFGTATINALDAGRQRIDIVSSSAATVYAGPGDTVAAAPFVFGRPPPPPRPPQTPATGLVVFGPEVVGAGQLFMTVKGGLGSELFRAVEVNNVSVTDSSGTLTLSAPIATIVGAASDTIVAGVGTQLINGVGINQTNPGGSINEWIVVNDVDASFGGSGDTVWGGSGDTIGVGGSETLSGSQFWLNSSLSGGAVGFGTFSADTTKTGSAANVTVGTVSGGAASEGFDSVSGDFFFYPGQDAIDVLTVIASATSVDVGGVASTRFSLPDGTTMTAIGVTTLSPLMFKPVPS
jgi:hypothetical protein